VARIAKVIFFEKTLPIAARIGVASAASGFALGLSLKLLSPRNFLRITTMKFAEATGQGYTAPAQFP
jgi:hypothetical protein